MEHFQNAYKQIMRHASGVEKLPSDIVKQYSKTWRETIINGLQYLKDTMFIDFPFEREEINLETTYCFSTFAKPGKHKVYLFDPPTNQWFLKNIQVQPCQFDQPNVKAAETKEKEAKSVNSIFKDRKKEGVKFYREAFECDEFKWKVGRLIKNEDEYKSCKEIVLRYFERLSDIFISLASRSKFPNLDNFTVVAFFQHIGWIDKNVINLSAIDRLYIASSVKSGNALVSERIDETSMIRCEFIEFLIRIADLKYRQAAKVVSTTGECV